MINLIEAKISDGSKIKFVKATLIRKDDPKILHEVQLNDNGIEGDKADGDLVFSYKIPEKKFGFYRVLIEASDFFDNKLIEDIPGEVTLH